MKTQLEHANANWSAQEFSVQQINGCSEKIPDGRLPVYRNHAP